MTHVGDIEFAILEELSQEGPCTMDELVRRLSSFTWNQVFAVVDRLSRQGKLLIQSKRRFEYEVSVPQGSPSMVHAAEGQMTHSASAA